MIGLRQRLQAKDDAGGARQALVALGHHAALVTLRYGRRRGLGVEETAGTLEEGKRADIVVLDANPLADARNTRKVRLVLQAGRPYTPAGLVQEAVTHIHEQAIHR